MLRKKENIYMDVSIYTNTEVSALVSTIIIMTTEDLVSVYPTVDMDTTYTNDQTIELFYRFWLSTT